jgi:hypothetical protein
MICNFSFVINPNFTLAFNAGAQNKNKMDTIPYKEQWSKKEVQALFKNYILKPRIDLKEERSPFDYYELPFGKLLLVLRFGQGTGTMYRSEEEFKQLMSRHDVREPGEHMMSNLIVDSNEFLNKIDLYVDLLAKKLNIPRNRLDYSLKSLNLIDSIYAMKRPEKNIFFNEDYLYLITYLGETYRKKRGGEWNFEREPGIPSWIPYIKLSNGVNMDVYIELFKECYENYEHMSIFGVADFELLKSK